MPFMKTQVFHEAKTAEIHDINDNPARIIGSIKLHVHGGRMTELASIHVCERQDVAAIPRCDVCHQCLEFIQPKARSVQVFHASTIPLVRH